MCYYIFVQIIFNKIVFNKIIFNIFYKTLICPKYASSKNGSYDTTDFQSADSVQI